MRLRTRISAFLSCGLICYGSFSFFFFNDTATTEIYTLSLHDALPILNNVYCLHTSESELGPFTASHSQCNLKNVIGDRKSTRLNSSHQIISYAVFCLKKKNNKVRRCLHFRAHT